MGAYLSEPILDKHSADENGDFLSFGASSMQGWRISQEDAHNATIDYDKGKSFFAVYDGHGGHEVAHYCSQYLPDFIKQNENFKTGNYEKALKESFIAFDATLVDRKVVEKLKIIAKNGADEEDEAEQAEEINNLCEEASMPIEEVMAKYGAAESNGCHSCSDSKEEADEVAGEAKPVNRATAALMHREKKKPISPFLRGKQASIGEGSSSLGQGKHIHFDENGDVVEKNGGEAVKSEADKDATSGEPKPVSNGDCDESSETTPVKEERPVNGTSNGDGSPDGNEKENRDVNGTDANKVKGESTEQGNASPTEKPDHEKIIKGKGKGKGKGKSNVIHSNKSSEAGQEEDAEEAPLSVAEKATKKRKTASEIYNSLLKASPGSGDEDSEDSEDEEFGGEIDSDDDDDDEDLDELEDSEDLDEPDDEDEDEDEEDDDDDEEDEDDEDYLEADFTEEPGNDSGCTAVVALLAGTKLYVANAGDSRCVVCRDGKAHDMSADHKPEDELESTRICKAGGKVTPDGRVNGGLNLSRAIGDHAYKQNKTLPLKDQMISPLPDVLTLDVDPAKDPWMILACDGIWNSMSSQEVVDFVNARIEDTPDDKLSSICEELFDHCLSPDTHGDGTGCDNMTAVIIKFKPEFRTVKDSLSGSLVNGSQAAVGCSSSSSTSDLPATAAACSSSSSSSSNEVDRPLEDEAKSNGKRGCDTEEADEGSSSDPPASKRTKLDNGEEKEAAV